METQAVLDSGQNLNPAQNVTKA